MPVPIVRRYAVLAIVAATVFAIVVAVAPFAVTAAKSAPPAPDTLMKATVGLRSEATRVELVVGSSEARYHAQEVLVGRGANEAIGRTNNVSGTIQIEADGTIAAEQSRILVDMTSLQSDSNTRDNYIKRNTLQVGEFPNALFVVTSVPGLPVPLPTSGTAEFELVGDLTVHGVTRPATWQASATFADREVTGTATTTVLMTDFGMTPPKVGSVVSIEDSVKLALDVRATVAPSLAELLSDPY
ncbi:MAG TPA: YceI family protein [Chloroflexota bacterium]|nr:YceI family protein [Chloroflexota bacterium]